MIHIVINTTLGFGCGGRETGQTTYVVAHGRIVVKERGIDGAKLLWGMLRALDLRYKTHRLFITLVNVDSNTSKCDTLLKKLCKETIC